MASSDGPPSLTADSYDGLRASELQPMDTDFAEGLVKHFEQLNLKTNEELMKSWENIEMYTRVAGKKLTVIEERLMKDTFQLHECVRMIKTAIDTYKEDLADLNWLSSVIIRELNTFELAERRRLSCDVIAGFVLAENTKNIVQKKIEMVILTVCIQAKTELSHHDSGEWHPTEMDWQIETLRKNLKYLIDIIVPFSVNLKNFVSVEQSLADHQLRYTELNRELKTLENYVVSPYNNERAVMDVVDF
jgi:hypothetical protein